MNWTTFKKKPCTIGASSRGFLVPKNKLFLEANQEYVIKIIPKNLCPKEVLEELEEENEDADNRF